MSAESTKKIIGVALGVCIVCSILVSSAAVALKSHQEENKKLEKIKNILIAGDLLKEDKGIEETYNQYIEAAIIDLESGQPIPEEKYTDDLNTKNFDVKTIASNPNYIKKIPPDKDLAGIKTMPKYMAVYYVKQNTEISKIILPIYGKGLWSTMYGFIALDKDLRTIEGFTFYEHGETPGLGGEVDNPRWKNSWKGKKAFDENGNERITVIKGRVDPSSDQAKYEVDGLSGSTLTTRGVDHLVKFWLGDEGYGPFFERLRGDLSNVQT
jgi:Na+-transporting NADH:ubiquinone oxidoreductase subunit C